MVCNIIYTRLGKVIWRKKSGYFKWDEDCLVNMNGGCFFVVVYWRNGKEKTNEELGEFANRLERGKGRKEN